MKTAYLVLVVSALAAPAWPVDDAKRASSIRLYLQSTMWMNETEGRESKKPKHIDDNTVALDSHPKEVVSVWIGDYNPFLYSYKWKGVTTEPTPDYVLAKKFADALATLPTAMLGIVDLTHVGTESKLLMVQPNAFGGARYKSEILKADASDEISKILDAPTITALAQLITTLAARVSKFDAYIENASDYTLQLPADGGQPWKDALIEIDKWKLADDDKVAKEGFKKVREARRTLIERLIKNPTVKPTSPLVEVVELLSLEETNVYEMIRAETDFAAKAKEVGRPSKPIGIIRMTAANVSTAPIEFTKLSPPDAKAALVTVSVTPYNPIVFALGPAYVYNFRKSPVDDSEVGSQAAIMLSLAPRRWADNLTSLEGQIGVSPSKNAIGFFVGAGVRVQGLFDFAGGIAYQQVKTKAAPNETFGFKWGGWVGVTVNVKSGK